MKILLTGASGFVGQAAVRAWRDQGHEVIQVGRDPDSDKDGSVLWDIAKPPPLGQIPAGIEAIVHMAQSRSHRRFPEDAMEMFAVNVAATQHLLELGTRLGIKRFCLISSGNVYEPYDNLEEEAPLRPRGYLGASKLAAEVLARPYAGLFDLCVIRLFQPYGPGQTDRLIPELVRRVKSGEAISVGADGQGVRLSPTFVDDLVEVILDAVIQGWTGAYNVATPEVLSIRQIGEMIGEMLNRAPSFALADVPTLWVSPRLDKLAQVSSLSRFRPFEAGLRLTLNENLPLRVAH